MGRVFESPYRHHFFHGSIQTSELDLESAGSGENAVQHPEDQVLRRARCGVLSHRLISRGVNRKDFQAVKRDFCFFSKMGFTNARLPV